MARKFSAPKLVIASHNAGKVSEIADLLKPFGTEVVSAGDLNLPEPVEDGDTFIANAELKAKAASLASGLPSLADDSGLAVIALNGDPGIYSARWAGPSKDFTLAMEKIEQGLGEVASSLDAGTNVDRSAYFVCALSLAWPADENSHIHMETFEGRVNGELVWPARGDQGFGYDPIFVPNGHQITFAEMGPEGKLPLTHRADAFRQLVEGCFS